MLKAQQERQKYWHSIVESKEGSSSPSFGHKGQIWLEQERIVIIAYQAIPDIGQQNRVQARLLMLLLC